jgi:hypothetical protein
LGRPEAYVGTNAEGELGRRFTRNAIWGKGEYYGGAVNGDIGK